MPTGRVIFFNADKGFGFIEPNVGGPDVFVHIASIAEAGLPGLTEGQEISYTLRFDEQSGRASAIQLKLASDCSPKG